MKPQGFGASQGVFREHYFKSGPFKGNQLVASIGLLVVVCSGGGKGIINVLTFEREYCNHCHLSHSSSSPHIPTYGST